MHSKGPDGPFLPFNDKEPHTPMDRMALDGTLWEENRIPYMIYCHEGVQIGDGTMELVQLEHALSRPVEDILPCSMLPPRHGLQAMFKKTVPQLM